MKSDLTPFQKGADFVLHFTGKKFTIDDIKDRYCCTYRQAINLKNLAEGLVSISPAGLSGSIVGKRGVARNLWEMKLS